MLIVVRTEGAFRQCSGSDCVGLRGAARISVAAVGIGGARFIGTMGRHEGQQSTHGAPVCRSPEDHVGSPCAPRPAGRGDQAVARGSGVVYAA